MLVGSDQEPAMNAFYEHHRDSTRFGDRWHYLANWRMQVATQKLRNTDSHAADAAGAPHNGISAKMIEQATIRK